MPYREIFEQALVLQVGVTFLIALLMIWRRAIVYFPAVFAYLMMTALSGAETFWFLFGSRHMHSRTQGMLYFYAFWGIQILSLVLDVLIIYGIFAEAMRPFPGLQHLGKIVFRWIGAASLAVSLALAAGPDLFAKKLLTGTVLLELYGRMQQGISVLILCLMIFVCFAIRPLGLTFRSRIFGVVLGLATLSTVQLVQAAWFATAGGSMYSPVYTFGIVGTIVSVSIWGVYFALPQPKRKMILLPTTSPFFFWNRISEILGDAPGHVAVAGFTPDMLAPGEIQMLTAAITQEEAAEREREEAQWHELQSSVPMPEFAKVPPGAMALLQ